MRNDWAGPYTGATNAARFLKSIHADKQGCNGYGDWAVGVQPYFDHNIFINYGGPQAPASFHWSDEFVQRVDFVTPKQLRNGPPLILWAARENQQAMALIEDLKSRNYRLIYNSIGTRFFKHSRGPREFYLVFERTDFASPQASNP
jgi:hypothetical protein